MRIKVKTLKEVETTFFSKIKLLKETGEVFVHDLTILAREDSMIIICTNHLDSFHIGYFYGYGQ